MSLAPHQQRVVDEYAEVDERARKLDAFIKTETFASLDVEDCALMRQQLRAMAQYAHLLNQRIARFQ